MLAQQQRAEGVALQPVGALLGLSLLLPLLLVRLVGLAHELFEDGEAVDLLERTCERRRVDGHQRSAAVSSGHRWPAVAISKPAVAIQS